jgi:phage terminase Nu1 subunit (DNA packaging protein)
LSNPAVFSSWKEIATFFGKSVRTVQRWERTLGLPIIRPENTTGNIVLARVADLESWMEQPANREIEMRTTAAAQDWAQSRLECRRRVARMESLLADLTRHTERLKRNTSAMGESCLRMKALSTRGGASRRTLEAAPPLITTPAGDQLSA